MDKISIKKIQARQIFDSRGNPTVEASVVLDNGVEGIASVPSGASTGAFEACELRDNLVEYCGKGVSNAVNNVNITIAEGLCNKSFYSQSEIDKTLIALDGTQNKSHLGANATLAVSLASAKAGAKLHNMQLYKYIGGINANVLPTPMMNILNGGAHANNNIDIQEFMIMPVGATSFTQAMKICVEIYHALGGLLKAKGLTTTVGDEGGYAPNLDSDEMALDLIMQAIENAGYKPFHDIKIALDAAATEWFANGQYQFPKRHKVITNTELIAYFRDLSTKYPIVSIEDPLSEDDFGSFREITRQIGKSVQIVGDDLFVTNQMRLQKGITMGAANAILIKPNQIGTLTETLLAINTAHAYGYNTIISHRSGETEDTSIADIAVGVNAGQIKTGAPARSDRVSKYNRLLKIEKELCDSAIYLGGKAIIR